MEKIFLCGYYGFKNIGDEALLETIYNTIKEINPKLKIDALSYNVKYTEKVKGLRGFSRGSIIKLISKIMDSDCIIFGGGSILQDVTSSKSLLYYLGIIMLGKFFGKPVALIGNGFGPVNKSFNKKLVRFVLNKVDYISIRDKNAIALLKKLGINSKIELSADIAFMIEGWQEKDAFEIFKRENIPCCNKMIGISIRNWKDKENYTVEIKKFAEYLLKKGYEIVFLPMQFPRDVEISKEIAENIDGNVYVIEGEYTPKEMIKIISEMHIVIAMRLHALIFSTIAKIPAIAIEYDPKVNSFAKESGIINSGKIEKLKYQGLISKFNELEKEYDDKKNILDEICSSFYERSKINKEILEKILNNY